MAVLAGLAMLAAPITAAAFDNGNHAPNDSRPAHAAHSANMPAHNGRPGDVNGHGFHNDLAPGDRDWHDNHNPEAHGWGEPGYRGPGYGPGYRGPGYGPGYAEGYWTRGYPVVVPVLWRADLHHDVIEMQGSAERREQLLSRPEHRPSRGRR